MPTPHIDWREVRAAASAFSLAMPRTPLGGRLGERLGAGVGSSLEFQDYRQYAPGDDLRHVDWAAYARSEALAVRLYREEVAPRVDIVLDVSRSMAVDEKKLQGYGSLAALVACASISTEADTRVITRSGVEPEPVHHPEAIERFLECDKAESALEAVHLPLRRQSMRVVISDFLFPHDGEELVRRFARDGASLSLLQITLPEEAEPQNEGGVRLIDIEGGGEMDLIMDERTVADYRERFNRLRLQLSRTAAGTGARFVHVLAGIQPREAARALARAGILEPL